MYSPKISDKFIPPLYRKAKQEGVPMTKLIDKIVELFFAEEVPTISQCPNCCPNSTAHLNHQESYCTTCGVIVLGSNTKPPTPSLSPDEYEEYLDYEDD
jgi:hypothetical protein